MRDIASAIERRASAEHEIAACVTVARAEGHSWATIGAMLGTSGEAARQRYGAATRNPGRSDHPQRRGKRTAARETT